MRKSISTLAFFACALAAGGVWLATQQPIPTAALGLLGIFLWWSIEVAAEWERAVVLRAGRFLGLKGPGVFMIVPILDTVVYYIDQRVAPSFSGR